MFKWKRQRNKKSRKALSYVECITAEIVKYRVGQRGHTQSLIKQFRGPSEAENEAGWYTTAVGMFTKNNEPYLRERQRGCWSDRIDQKSKSPTSCR